MEKLSHDAFIVKTSGNLWGDLDLQDPSEFPQLKQECWTFACHLPTPHCSAIGHRPPS